MILRFRSQDGQFRLETDPTADFSLLSDALMAKISATSPEQVLISQQSLQLQSQPLTELFGHSITELGLKNGSMLLLLYEKPAAIAPVAPDVANALLKIDALHLDKESNLAPSSIVKPRPTSPPHQSPLDDLLDRKLGVIKRPKLQFCQHGDKGMCEYCQSLPPWDSKYLAEHEIKHMLFHSHVKQLNELKNNPHNASSYMPPIEEPDYAQLHDRKTGRRHGPSVITLKQQQFRMVDHVQMADLAIVNRFIDVWRQTGVQRLGYLYGRYDEYELVPLGVKCVVEAIFEPPQAGEADGVTLLPWEDEDLVDSAAHSLGLTRVGVIFTDLTDLGLGNGSVLCKRHKDTYFLLCLETIFAAKHQLKFKNSTRHLASGVYSLKFVTCVVLGGLEGQIEPRSYQVSVPAEALVKAGIVCGSTHALQLWVEDDGKNPVPEIYFLMKNEYGLEVKTNAKPSFPVDYLLVLLSDGFPLEPKPKFQLLFAIENRDFMGDLQELKNAYRALTSEMVKTALSDFHLLIYIAKLGVLSKEELALLFAYVDLGNDEDFLRLVETPGWMTLLTVLEQS